MGPHTYVLVHESDKGTMVFRRTDRGSIYAVIRIWPMHDRPDGEIYYKAQDGFLHTWELSAAELREALRYGIKYS